MGMEKSALRITLDEPIIKEVEPPLEEMMIEESPKENYQE